MTDSAYKGDGAPFNDDADQDLLGTPTSHEEFISEIGQVLDLPDIDPEGYVGPDGRMQPHQSPAEVEAERDETLEIEAHAHPVRQNEPSAQDVRDVFE